MTTITKGNKAEIQRKLIEKYQTATDRLPVCLNENCAMRATCLSALAKDKIDKERKTITIVNPLLYPAAGEDCQFFAPATQTKTLALGFERQYEAMKQEYKERQFQDNCKRYFNKTYYYNLRGGLHIISPEEQEKIISCAKEVGYDFPVDGFDYMFTVIG